jgi:hypothetical protein
MPRAKRKIQSEFSIDGFSLVWHLHRDQQWCTADGWKGVAIHVKLVEGVRRELHLEYPAVVTQKRGYTRIDPIQPAILTARVETHIRQAMEAGWDPESRGKPFVYEVEDSPG